MQNLMHDTSSMETCLYVGSWLVFVTVVAAKNDFTTLKFEMRKGPGVQILVPSFNSESSDGGEMS